MSRPQYKTLNVDLATWEVINDLAEIEDRTLISVVRRAIRTYAQKEDK
ncbi:MAG: hypothetical protein AB1679_14270 [Actinomycetota bacterium]|jgi:hypothetical protein